jgi:hypothetical protein
MPSDRSTQCCDMHDKSLPVFACAQTPRRDLSSLQTSPTRVHFTTGSDVVPTGFSFDVGPQPSTSIITNKRHMERP